MKKILFRHLTIVIIIFLLIGCNSRIKDRAESVHSNAHLVNAVLWFQNSAEAMALFYQAFNMAKFILDREIELNNNNKELAIIVDIDETILDNSPYEAKLIKENKNYPFGWEEWCNLAVAKAIPGSSEFLNYAASKGIHIFYISNRKTHLLQSTMRNLKDSGFPDVKSDNILLRVDDNNKERRRRKITERYKIVLLIGDNLNDFSEIFYGKSTQHRMALVGKLKEQFGTRFILLPNPMYGDWENAIFGYNSEMSDEEKQKLRLESLRSY